MKQTQYKLKTVIDVRRRGKESASKNVFLKRNALDLEKQELERRSDSLARHRSKIENAELRLSNELNSSTNAPTVISHKNFIESLRIVESELLSSVEEQIRAVKAAEQEVESAVQKLLESARELAVIEKHKEKWELGESKRVTKEEQKLIDEVSSILHVRSKNI